MRTAAFLRFTLLLVFTAIIWVCMERPTYGFRQLVHSRNLWQEDSSSRSEATESTDSLSQEYWRALSRLSTPKLKEKKQLLRAYQQRGYAYALAEVLRTDGLSALLSFLRTRLQIEYSIPHDLVMVDITAKHRFPPDSGGYLPRNKPTIILPTRPNESIRIGLDIDWKFPDDPWRRE